MTIEDTVVLLVEDDPDNTKVARHLLNFAGIQHSIVIESGVEALDFIRRLADAPQRIDLALLDVHMAKVDGFRLLQEIRATPSLEGMPVVAITASIMPEQMAEIEQTGFDGLLGKPLDMDRFPDQIRRILAGEHVWEAV
jgi:two-component system cell cycle response regulator DivK